MPGSGATSYDGFISYSHAADGLLAPRLQSGLQRFAKPWWKTRAVRIFRDETSLSANPHLWTSITDALDQSVWLILLLSPEAATSKWINQEIEYWIEHKDRDRILPVVTDGTFEWVEGDVDGDAVPASLHGVFADEPRWVDLRFARTETQLDLRHARFGNAVADIAAAVRGVAKDELESEEIRQHRRTVRTVWTAAIALVALASAAVGFAVQSDRNATLAEVNAEQAEASALEARQTAEAEAAARLEADTQRSIAEENAAEADRQRTIAESNALEARVRELVAESTAALEIDPELSTLLALEAVARGSGGPVLPEVEAALHRAVTASNIVMGVDGTRRVSISGDGRRIAHVAGQDLDSTKAHVWDTESGERLFEPPLESITAVALDPSGERLAVGVSDGSVTLWQVDTGVEVLRTPILNEHRTFEVSTSATAGEFVLRFVWIGSESGRYQVADTAPIVPGLSSDQLEGVIEAMDIFDDAIVAGSGGTADPWVVEIDAATIDDLRIINARDVSPGRVSTDVSVEWEGHGDWIVSTRFSRDGTTLATLGNDGRLRMWDIASGAQLWERMLTNWYNSGLGGGMDFHPDGRTVAVQDPAMGETRVYEVMSGDLVVALPGVGWMFDVAYLPDGESLVATHDMSFVLWDVSTETIIDEESFDLVVYAVDIAESGEIAITLDDGRVVLYEVTGNGVKRLDDIPAHEGAPVDLQFNADGSLLATVSFQGGDNRVRLWDTSPAGFGEPFALAGEIGAPWADVSPDGTLIAAATPERMVALFDAHTGEPTGVTIPDAYGRPPDEVSRPLVPYLYRIRFTPDGRSLVTAGAYGMRLWDTTTGDLRATLATTEVSNVSFAEPNLLVATVVTPGPWNSIVFWDLTTLEEIRRLESGEGGEYHFAEASPDGRYLVALGPQVLVFDLATLEVIHTLPMVRTVMEGNIAFSPDSEYFAIGDTGGVATIYRTETGQVKREITGHTAHIARTRFSPDGTQLATASSDKTIRLWDLATGNQLLVLESGDVDHFNIAFTSDGRLISTAGNGVVRSWMLDLDDLVEIARDRLTRDFTAAECATYRIEPCPTEPNE